MVVPELIWMVWFGDMHLITEEIQRGKQDNYLETWVAPISQSCGTRAVVGAWEVTMVQVR